jgi:amino acid transporter
VDLVFMNVVAVTGPRWIASASRYGAASLTLWVLAFLAFFVPQGLVITELSSRYPQEGGIYVWTKKAFGDFHGFVCGWCYWINNLFYFPSLLIFTVTCAAYIGGPDAAGIETRAHVITTISLLCFWFVIWVNIRGMKVGKWLQNLGAVGIWIPALVLILMGGSAYYMFGPANPVTVEGLKPDFSASTLTFWAQMCFGFAGLEVTSLLGGEVRKPRKNIPRGVLIGGLIVAAIYISGTLSVYIALPSRDISIVSGLMQAIAEVTTRVGVVWILPIMAFLLAVSGLGGTSAWVAGSARVPYVAGLDKYLPGSFGKIHPRYGSPYVAILFQGVVSSVIIATGYLADDVPVAYLTLVNITLIVYFLPYLYLFAAAITLRFREGIRPGMIPIPGGKAGTIVAAVLGFTATAVSILLAMLFPPAEVTNVFLFEAVVIGACLACFLSGAWLYARARRTHPAVRS